VSGFADVQALMVMGRTGVVVWDAREDVTLPASGNRWPHSCAIEILPEMQ
jgi:hypothetical protein